MKKIKLEHNTKGNQYCHFEFSKSLNNVKEKAIIPIDLINEDFTTVKLISVSMNYAPNTAALGQSGIILHWNGDPAISTINNTGKEILTTEFYYYPLIQAGYPTQTDIAQFARYISKSVPQLEFWLTYNDGKQIDLGNTNMDPYWNFHISLILN